MYILIDQLESVEDPRIGNAKRHKLGDILFMAIAAGVAGADGWYEIVEYARVHEAFFANTWNCHPEYLLMIHSIECLPSWIPNYSKRIINNG